MENTQLNHVIIGSLLKAQRDKIGISQSEIAARLKYNNANYISMLENGRTNIPPKRIKDVILSYEFGADATAVFIKALLSDTWELFEFFLTNEKEEIPTTSNEVREFNNKIEKRFKDYLKEYNLDVYIPMLGKSG